MNHRTNQKTPLKTKLHRRLEAHRLRLKKKSDQLATYRLLAFLAMAASWWLHPWLPVAMFALFWFFVRVHARTKRMAQLFESRLRVLARQQATTNLQWSQIPLRPELTTESAGPDYLSDLDVIGSQSLLRLVDWTSSTSGSQALFQLFADNGVSEVTINERTRLVSELRHLPVLRHAYLARAQIIQERIDTPQILSLLQHSLLARPTVKALMVVTYGLQVAMIGSWLWFFFRGGSPYFVVPGVLLLVANLGGRKLILTGTAFGWALSLAGALGHFRTSVALLEKYSQTHRAELHKILAPLRGEHSATRHLKQLETIIGALATRQNPVVHLLLHLILPWDFFWTMRLNKLQKTLVAHLPGWDTSLAQFESFLSIAQYAEANPDFLPATLSQSNVTLSGEMIRHPLIPKNIAVANPLRIDPTERCILITGSNMSGKSTFLRSVGLNLLLARAGSSVAATKFEFQNLPLHSSLRGSDSLQEGLSSFYAEVKRLKSVLSEAERHPIFFLIDEIFRGTNNRERLIGSRAYIQKINALGSYGLVTTHDLELAALESEHPGIVNYHFRESIIDSNMTFSYRKERGPCPTTNALQVMKLAGLPV